MRLRRAAPADAPVLARILGDWQRETPWMPVLHSQDANLRHMARVLVAEEVRVAEASGVVLGFLARDGAEVSKLFVDAPARGRGMGAALLAEAQGRCDRLYLWTFQANTGARAFYARAGFREVQRTDGAGNEERLPDLRLCWERDVR
jgi:GNAT superfamily N-acetyltransferase